MQAKSTFEIRAWDESAAEQIPGGHALSRATVTKTFHGDLEGERTAELLMSKGSGDYDLDGGADS